MRVHVDNSLCEANGVCVGLAPAVFSLDEEDELHIARDGEVPEGEVERVTKAVERCPKTALSISDDDS